MSDPNPMTVTIDDAIRARPDLLARVEEASDYFRQLYEPRTPTDPPLMPSLNWTLSPLVAPPLWAEVHERDTTGERKVSRGIGERDLEDPVRRDVHMLKLWGDLLNNRSDKRMSMLDELIRRAETLEREGAHGFAVAN